MGTRSLSNTFAFVQTDSIAPGTDSDGNGLPDAWELLHFGHIGVSPSGDADGDGVSNLQEYLADTDPMNPSSVLRITQYAVTGQGASDTIVWTSQPTRQYYIQKTANLNPTISWTDAGLGLIIPNAGPTTKRVFSDSPSPQRFF